MIRVSITSIVDGVNTLIKRWSGSGRSGETFSRREFFQHYGFTSRPQTGAKGIVLKKGCSYVMIASDDSRYRFRLTQDGEVAIYTDEGDLIHLKRNNIIEIKSQSKVIVDAPAIELGTGTLRSFIDERILGALNNHIHTTAAGPTSAAVASVVTNPAPPFLAAIHATSVVKGN